MKDVAIYDKLLIPGIRIIVNAGHDWTWILDISQIISESMHIRNVFIKHWSSSLFCQIWFGFWYRKQSEWEDTSSKIGCLTCTISIWSWWKIISHQVASTRSQKTEMPAETNFNPLLLTTSFWATQAKLRTQAILWKERSLNPKSNLHSKSINLLIVPPQWNFLFLVAIWDVSYILENWDGFVSTLHRTIEISISKIEPTFNTILLSQI